MTARKPRKTANRIPPAIVQQRILAYVTERGEARVSSIAAALRIALWTARRHAKALSDKGAINQVRAPSETANCDGSEYLFWVGERVNPVAMTQTSAPIYTPDPCALPRDFFRCGAA